MKSLSFPKGTSIVERKLKSNGGNIAGIDIFDPFPSIPGFFFPDKK